MQFEFLRAHGELSLQTTNSSLHSFKRHLLSSYYELVRTEIRVPQLQGSHTLLEGNNNNNNKKESTIYRSQYRARRNNYTACEVKGVQERFLEEAKLGLNSER